MDPAALAGMIIPASKEKTGKIPNPLKLASGMGLFSNPDQVLPADARILEAEVCIGLRAQDDRDKKLLSGLTHVDNVIRPYSFAHTAHYHTMRWFAPAGKTYTIDTLSSSSLAQKRQWAFEDQPGITRAQVDAKPDIKDHTPVYIMMTGRDGVFLWQREEPFVILPHKPNPRADYRQAGALADATVTHRRLNHKSLELDVGLQNYGPQFRFWCPQFTTFHNNLVDLQGAARHANLFIHGDEKMPGIYCAVTPPLLDKLESTRRFVQFIPDGVDKLIHLYSLALNHGFVGVEPRMPPLTLPRADQLL